MVVEGGGGWVGGGDQRGDAERDGCRTGLTGAEKRGEKQQRLNGRRAAENGR